MPGKCEVVKPSGFFCLSLPETLSACLKKTHTDETSSIAFNLAVCGTCLQPIMRHHILNIEDFCRSKAAFTGTPNFISQQCFAAAICSDSQLLFFLPIYWSHIMENSEHLLLAHVESHKECTDLMKPGQFDYAIMARKQTKSIFCSWLINCIGNTCFCFRGNCAKNWPSFLHKRDTSMCIVES